MAPNLGAPQRQKCVFSALTGEAAKIGSRCAQRFSATSDYRRSNKAAALLAASASSVYYPHTFPVSGAVRTAAWARLPLPCQHLSSYWFVWSGGGVGQRCPNRRFFLQPISCGGRSEVKGQSSAVKGTRGEAGGGRGCSFLPSNERKTLGRGWGRLDTPTQRRERARRASDIANASGAPMVAPPLEPRSAGPAGKHSWSQ